MTALFLLKNFVRVGQWTLQRHIIWRVCLWITNSWLRLRHCFKRDKTFGYMQKYMLGLMANLKRKSIEPVALASGVAVRTCMPNRENILPAFSVNGAVKQAKKTIALLVSICFIQITTQKIHSAVLLPAMNQFAIKFADRMPL